MIEDIASLRAQIDSLDRELLALVNRRAGLARRVGELKQGAPAYRPEREAEILRRAVADNPGPLPPERVTGIFREVISACRGMEQEIRASYLGPQGTFSEQAVQKHFGHAVQAIPLASIDEVFRRAESGDAEFAVVPVENSTEGAIGRTLDLLVATPLRICAEVELRVQQNLMAKDADILRVKRVYSHAQSLAQCHGWLNQNLPNAERVQVMSNAEAARRAASEPETAAIAGQMASERFGLSILARSIEDDPNNTTRFIVLGKIGTAPTGRDRTSLVMSAENKPGAVHALLSPLAANRVSMSRIESRPSRAARSSLWEYLFFIDVEGHQDDARVASALAELAQKASFLKILGSYPVAVQ
ncbi:MAG: prephenate dehydratase [Betaproteobacteria bacterium]|nr:prephenate dehydratase [Betaproteobacteria bacterium]